MQVESAVNESLKQAFKSTADATKLLLAEAEELGDINFEDDESISDETSQEDDYLPHAGAEPPRSTFDDLKNGIVDVAYTYANVNHMIVGVRLKNSTSVYEQVAVDIARHMRWGDVVEAQFAEDGPLSRFYNRVESIAHPRNGRTSAIVAAISNAHILPPSYEFPWQSATQAIVHTQTRVARLYDDASLGMKQCHKRRVESHDAVPIEAKSPKRAKLQDSSVDGSKSSSCSASDDDISMNERAGQVTVAMAQNHSTCAHATGSGSQKSGWQTVEEVEETGSYEPSSPSYSPTDPQYEPEMDATIDATMLPEDAKRFLMDHAEYGYNDYDSSKGHERKVVVVGKPYYWKNRTYSFSELPDSFSKFVKANKLEKYNSLLCNLYETNKAKIALHMDNTSLLKEGNIVSFSYAIHPMDKHETLAKMVFTSHQGDVVYPLYHGSRIEFDAFKDAKCNKRHEVRRTDYPRINLTFRVLK